MLVVYIQLVLLAAGLGCLLLLDKATHVFPQRKAAATSDSTWGGKMDKLELRVFFLVFFFCGQNGDPSTPMHLYIMDYQKYTAVGGGREPGAFCLAELGKEGCAAWLRNPQGRICRVFFSPHPPLCVCVLDARRIKKKNPNLYCLLIYQGNKRLQRDLF